MNRGSWKCRSSADRDGSGVIYSRNGVAARSSASLPDNPVTTTRKTSDAVMLTATASNGPPKTETGDNLHGALTAYIVGPLVQHALHFFQSLVSAIHYACITARYDAQPTAAAAPSDSLSEIDWRSSRDVLASRLRTEKGVNVS